MANEWKRGTFVFDAGLGHTPTTLMNAIQSFLTQVGWVRASWDTNTLRCFLRADRNVDDYWMFNGDGAPQACGIQAELDTPNSRVILRCFLENQAQDAVQRATYVRDEMYIHYDVTAPNNLLFIGGKFGFYYEDGRDGQPNNIAHGMILAWEPVPEYNGTDDARVHITTMGVCCDLFGPLKFSADRTFKLVDTRNGNRNYTGRLRPYGVRGAGGFNGQPQVNDPSLAIAPRDNLLSMYGASNPGGSAYGEGAMYSLGILLTPRDGRYRISPLMVIQASERFAASAQGGGDVDGPDGQCYFEDVRTRRQAIKFVVVDGTLLPFVNLTDAATSVIFRVAQVADNGRPANIGIAWPDNSNVVTVSGA